MLKTSSYLEIWFTGDFSFCGVYVQLSVLSIYFSEIKQISAFNRTMNETCTGTLDLPASQTEKKISSYEFPGTELYINGQKKYIVTSIKLGAYSDYLNAPSTRTYLSLINQSNYRFQTYTYEALEQYKHIPGLRQNHEPDFWLIDQNITSFSIVEQRISKHHNQ